MELYLFAGLAFLIAVFAVRLVVLELRVRAYTGGKKNVGSEGLIMRHSAEIGELKALLADLAKNVKSVQEELPCMVQKIGVVRFNPFSSSGGDQSFAVALLDSNNNGFVLSSLYLQNQTRTYAKPIEKGESPYTLSDEEKRALQKATESVVS